MKKNVLLIICMIFSISVSAQSKSTKPINNWGHELKQSPFGLGLDIQTKYMWRGMEMITEKSSPVLFPSVNYTSGGLFVYAMGGYAINGNYAEVDLGLSYSWRDLTIGLNDYYYPTVDNYEDNYFEGENIGHWFEVTITYAPEKIPIWITASNFFYGADKYVDENGKEIQAYSSYVELGTYYDFLENNRISLAIGAALNKSCYNGYEKDFSICNVEGKYTCNVKINNDWTLPLSVSYIYNPIYDKSFVNFTANIAF